MRFECVGHDVDYGGESIEEQQECPFGRLQRHGGIDCGRGVGRELAQDRADPCVGVLQMDAGVSLQGDHAVEVEDVVAGAAGGQVGVLDRADADLSRALVEFGGGQVRTPVGDRGAGAFDRLLQQGDQPYGLAGAGLERSPAGVEDRPERDVVRLHVVGER